MHKNRRDERYSLMIGNKKVPSVVLPFLNCTYVKNKANWIYNLNDNTEAGPVSMDIPKNVNVDGAIDDEYTHRERGSPVHESSPYYSPHIPASPTHTIQFSLTLFQVSHLGRSLGKSMTILLSRPFFMIFFMSCTTEMTLMSNVTSCSELCTINR